MKKQVKKHAEKEVNKENKESHEKQIRLVVFFMSVLIIVIFLVYFLIQESKKFEYDGLKFVKGKQGSLVLYYSSLPISDINGKVIGSLPFYLREDPRNLERISIDGEIRVGKEVILSATPEILKCDDGLLAATTLSMNLGKLGIKAIGATTNKTYAEENNMTYADYDTCLNTNYTTLLFKEGGNSKIRHVDNCYILDTANCEIMNVTERFIVGLYSRLMGVAS